MARDVCCPALLSLVQHQPNAAPRPGCASGGAGAEYGAASGAVCPNERCSVVGFLGGIIILCPFRCWLFDVGLLLGVSVLCAMTSVKLPTEQLLGRCACASWLARHQTNACLAQSADPTDDASSRSDIAFCRLLFLGLGFLRVRHRGTPFAGAMMSAICRARAQFFVTADRFSGPSLPPSCAPLR